MNRLKQMFKEVWIWDTEYVVVPGWRVQPICLSAIEVKSGQKITVTFDYAGQQLPNPMNFGPDALHITYMLCADLSFALAAGWGLPVNVIDPWVEFRNLTNGQLDNQNEKIEHNIIAACHYFGLYDTTPEAEKEANRARTIQGFPFEAEEMQRMATYCEGDTRILVQLCERLIPTVENLAQALHRGRCMKAYACVEWNGVPVDVQMLERLRANTGAVRRSLVHSFEDEYGAGIHTFDKKGDPHFNNDGYTG